MHRGLLSIQQDNKISVEEVKGREVIEEGSKQPWDVSVTFGSNQFGDLFFATYLTQMGKK